MKRSRWRWVFGMAAASAGLVPAAVAFGCVGVISLTTTSPTVQPGGAVTVVGREFAQGAPVDIRLDSPSGPVLATAPAPTTTMTSKFELAVTIPPDVKPGEHVLVATQNYHNMNGGAPARALIVVGTAPVVGATPTTVAIPRRASVLADSGPSPASLVLIGLGVAGAGLLLAAAWNVAASRRGPRSGPEAVTS